MGLLIRPDPRLQRLLDRLGIVYSLDGTLPTPARWQGRDLPVTSGFPFHRLRQVLKGAAVDVGRLVPSGDVGRSWQDILRRLDGMPAIDGEGDVDADSAPLDDLEAGLDAHQALEVLFVQHRVAVMKSDLSRAEATWSVFSRCLRHHLQVEDALVMPAYRERRPNDGWARGLPRTSSTTSMTRFDVDWTS